MATGSDATVPMTPIRVYYEDTDSGGVVYYANYLKFMERARTEWLRRLGVEQDRLLAEEGILFAVRSVEVEYLSPARFNDLLEVSARAVECRGASMVFAQQVRRGESLLCQGNVKIVSLDGATLRPKPVPKWLRALFPKETE